MRSGSPSPPMLALGLAALGAAAALATPARAAAGAELDQGTMAMGLFGGLALFLYGMDKMTDALQAAAGEKMKHFLGRLTSNRLLGVFTGAFVTAVIQSSSVTTVLVVGFISAGLMTLQQSIGVIMGANLGTTITAHIVAFKVTHFALLMIAVGYGLLFLSQRDRGKQWGGVIMGLGLLFYGMGVMSAAMEPLRSYRPFIDLMGSMENPMVGIAVAGLFTALIQSSSATTGIVIVMASQGLCSLTAGIALALGSNVGTCVTAVLASIGKPPEARRAATVHVLFNVLGVLLWLFFIPGLATMAQAISPSYPQLQGVDRLAAEVPRQIANANTLFNLTNTVLFLGFTGSFARLATWLVPDLPRTASRVLAETRYLDDDVIETPALALEIVRWELGDLGELVTSMLRRIAPASLGKDTALLEAIVVDEGRVDQVRQQILDYLGRIRERKLTAAQSRELQDLTGVTENLEHIADIVSKDLVQHTYRAMDEGIGAGETLQHILSGLYDSVVQAVETATRAVREDDQLAAEEVVAMKERISRQVRETLQIQADHLEAAEADRLVAFRIEMETIDDLRRIYTVAKRIAKVQLPDG